MAMKATSDEFKYDIETGERLHRDIKPLTIAYHGHTLTFDMPGWYPDGDGDGDGTFTKEDMKAYNRAINLLKAKEADLISPQEIRTIRRKLKLTQVEAGNILGGGKRAFQKYESGDILPSKAISNLLRILSIKPEMLKVCY